MADTTPQADQSAHELLLWLIPQLDKLPRVRRFTLGERLEVTLLDVLERLVEAAYSRDKRAALKMATAARGRDGIVPAAATHSRVSAGRQGGARGSASGAASCRFSPL